MSWLSQLAFYFLGLQFIAFGLNGFFNFIPLPKAPDQIEGLLRALEETKFIMPSVKLIEIVGGALCLIPSCQAIGLLLLMPIIFNIVGIHLVFNRKQSWIIMLQVFVPTVVALINAWDKLRLL
jgi:hypothetical protein